MVPVSQLDSTNTFTLVKPNDSNSPNSKMTHQIEGRSSQGKASQEGTQGTQEEEA